MRRATLFFSFSLGWLLVTAASASAAGATPNNGERLYSQTCAACHGADGKGMIPGAPDFTDPKGVLSNPDALLVKRIAEGYQSPGSPMAMPPKGGNPSLSRKDIVAILTYLRQKFGVRPK